MWRHAASGPCHSRELDIGLVLAVPALVVLQSVVAVDAFLLDTGVVVLMHLFGLDELDLAVVGLAPGW